VFPGQPRRFAEKLRSLGIPFYFYENDEGGHGMYITPQDQAKYYALFYTYLARRLMTRSP